MGSASIFLVCCCCLIATGLAKPAVYLGYQDSLGQYSFGYSAPGSARSEVRTSDGATRGTYSYVDETGVIHTAQYYADGEHGFRVFATNLPQAPLPVQETPEVMAARAAHLQAVELATRREEEAHSHEQSQGRKIEVSRGNEVNLVAKSGQLKVQAAEKTPYDARSEGDESLQAVASGSGVDEGREKNPQGTNEEFAVRATHVPSVSPHALLPHALGRHEVPVFRITHGNYEIEPSAVVPESPIAQDASGVITPAGTALKSGTTLAKEAAATSGRSQDAQHVDKQAETTATLIAAPVGIIPPSSSHSSIVGYVPPLRYIAYTVL